MRDSCCYDEKTMLSEDRVTTSVPTVYTRINPLNYSANDNSDDISSEDPFDAENERHHGFSRDSPHVIKTSTNVVVLPSINKWNCFSIRDRRSIDIIGSRDIMNTTSSASPTSALEINSLFSERVTDYPAPAGRSAGNDLTRNNSGYRRLTLREKLAKQRAEKGDDAKNNTTSEEPRRLTKTTSLSSASSSKTNNYRPSVRSQSDRIRNEGSSEEPTRLTKTTSLVSGSPSPKNNHRTANRSQSVAAITEEKTVFGFKIMKGLQGSSDSQNSNRTGVTRHGSSREPDRTNNYANRLRDKTGSTLFYTPMNNRVSAATSKSEETTEPEKIKTSKGREDPVTSETKVDDVIASENARDADKEPCAMVKETEKDSSRTVSTTILNVNTKKTRNIDSEESVSASQLSDKKHGNTDMKTDVENNHDNGVFKVSKEIEVKNEGGKTEKLLIRAESLREGKSRLEEFRRRGKLTRSLTNPDFEESENTTSNKGKNISESLAEIRERIRVRKRKKQQLKKSQSMPETDAPPKNEGEGNANTFSDEANEENIGNNVETKQSEVIRKTGKSSKELSDDTKDNIEKIKELEVSNNGSEESRDSKGSNLNALEYLEIEENSKANIQENNGSVTVIQDVDVIVKDSKSEKVIPIEDAEEKVQDTRVNDVIAVDTESAEKQKDMKIMDKNDSKVKESDNVTTETKRMELKEILSRENGTQNQTESTADTKTEVETNVCNDTASSSEQNEQEVKKPTKRDRKKKERYQRSKTMSAIMYNEISLDARREMQHKGSGTKSGDKNGESVVVHSVSEIKKRFAEADGGSTKIPELGLFYSGKTPASQKYSQSKTGENASAKDDSDSNRAKTSHTRSRKDSSRRHTLAIGTTIPIHVDQEKDTTTTNTDPKIIDDAKTESSTVGKIQTTETDESKGKLGRRHTLPSYTMEVTINWEEAQSPVDEAYKKAAEKERQSPLRRHTFSSKTNFVGSRHKPAKVAESVGTIREKFSTGEAPVFNLATSGKVGSSNDVDSNGQNRRRTVNDSTVRAIIEEAKMMKDAKKESKSSLNRGHTMANRPARRHSDKDEQEKQEFLDKFLTKDDEVEKSEKSDESTKDVESQAVQTGLTSRRTKKDKEEKPTVSKLKKLFLGQASNTEKKTKLRDRRAKTITGGISSDIMKEFQINNDTSVLPDKYVKPDLYVTDTAQEENKQEGRGRRRRSSDLNPDNYLSPIETGKNSVFDYEQSSESDVQPDVDANTSTEPSGSVVTSARLHSVGDSDMEITSSVSTRKEGSQDQVQDVIDLKTPTEFNSARRRSGSESDMIQGNNLSDQHQNLDSYLTTAINTLNESPKVQRASPRGSPKKGKFSSSQSFDQGESKHETKQHLDVVKSNLSLHSWSTSDLDKIIHGGDNSGSPSTSQVDISAMDFDEISSSTTRLHSLTENRAKSRPKRTSSKSLNPVKSLMERTDVRTHTEEPEEENNGFEKPKKRSNPRKKRSQLEPWRRHTLDPVALAALASREDFSRVSLRKTKGPGKEKDEYDGSLPVMLIQIKGRRQVQTRLVEPSLSSLNTGDCFILITPKELFCWIGQDANAIEKAKAVEISSKIQKRGDMNCKTGDVLYIDETKQGNTLAYRKFCKILNGQTDFPIEDAQLCPEDEFYEREVISTNKVYKLQEGDPPHLIPVTELCGYMPRIGILNTKEVFVFDFGSELYVWTGQQSLSNKRKVAFHLAEMLYKQQFDCEGVVSPIDPRRPMKRSSSLPVYRDAEGKQCGRPTWTLFARLHEKAETLLFQEKFFDWPDPTKIIKMKGHVSSGEIAERPPAVELKPCDPTEMQKPASDLEPVILEATNLGRGLGTPNVEVNGEVKEGDLVTTLGIKVWLVTQNRHFVLPKASEGHFHSGDGYVIRWVYFVAKNRVVRDKRGRIRPMTGRQRCAYFFWQGNECSVNEKGAAAIMAVELDEEHGPQIRVVEGKEPPHFLKLFDGSMVIHSGKRIRVNDEQDEFSDKSAVRMYCIRSEDISEGCLVQVTRSASSLRSRSSFVVVDSEQGNIFVWHGCKTNEYHRESAKKAANFIKDRHPVEMNLSEEISVTVTEIEEGRESNIFWSTVSGKKKSYLSLRNDSFNYDFCPRLFHMSSATGQFISTEILSPTRYSGRICPFPVLQDDLYSASQPSAFILDVGHEVYVWEGWMPAEITKDKRGSAKRRWDEERKLTLETTLSYVEEAGERINKGAYVVQAGLEPVSFTTHFPFWNPIQSITEIQQKEGKNGETKSVQEALDTFTKESYSYHELTSENPPDGVDPSKLETYLTDEEFEVIFEMSRDLFSQLPGWKQDILKKAFGLF